MCIYKFCINNMAKRLHNSSLNLQCILMLEGFLYACRRIRANHPSKCGFYFDEHLEAFDTQQLIYLFLVSFIQF